jgi:D-alanyl-D-alanine carboxypeptidase (penicillin-binding protein 5/6)
MAQFRFGPRRIKKEVQMDDFSLTLTSVLLIAIVAIILITAIYGIIFAISNPEALLPNFNIGGDDGDYPFRQDIELPLPEYSENSITIPADSITSEYAALYNVNTGEIVASRKSTERIQIASLTKIMTLIVVYENLSSEESLDDIIEIKSKPSGHSGYGLEVGDKLTVEELIYDAILRSDGIACLALADYIAGSEEDFVKLMNDKVKELGLLDDENGRDETNPSTKFMNCTGISQTYHCSTAYDMAVITAYAMKNPFCAEVLTTLKYKPSNEHFRPGESHTFWSMILHDTDKYNDGAVKSETVNIKGGKTGWTGNDSGRCLAVVATGKESGDQYILITCKGDTWPNAVSDTITIFDTYAD